MMAAASNIDLSAELSAVYDDIHTNGPKDITAAIRRETSALKSTFDPSTTIQPGQKLPEFSLPNAHNQPITSASLLANGPVLLVFYRGGWCPFCHIALRSYQQHLSEFQKYDNVQLVAITAEIPDVSITTMEKNELEYEVLSDVHLTFAQQLGIVWKQPEHLRKVSEHLGFEWENNYKQKEMDLPIPTVILAGRDGVVREAFVEPNYQTRLEPKEILGWLEKWKGQL